jgi:hypothetical protein
MTEYTLAASLTSCANRNENTERIYAQLCEAQTQHRKRARSSRAAHALLIDTLKLNLASALLTNSTLFCDDNDVEEEEAVTQAMFLLMGIIKTVF